MKRKRFRTARRWEPGLSGFWHANLELPPTARSPGGLLPHDPDSGTSKALVKAATDKNWSVRAAALEAIAQRGDRSLLPEIAAALDDANDVVRFSAAACVAHLSELPETESPAKP